jgi:hypothetical protein
MFNPGSQLSESAVSTPRANKGPEEQVNKQNIRIAANEGPLFRIIFRFFQPHILRHLTQKIYEGCIMSVRLSDTAPNKLPA